MSFLFIGLFGVCVWCWDWVIGFKVVVRDRDTLRDPLFEGGSISLSGKACFFPTCFSLHHFLNFSFSISLHTSQPLFCYNNNNNNYIHTNKQKVKTQSWPI